MDTYKPTTAGSALCLIVFLAACADIAYSITHSTPASGGLGAIAGAFLVGLLVFVIVMRKMRFDTQMFFVLAWTFANEAIIHWLGGKV